MKRLVVLFALAGLLGLFAAACAGEPEVVVEKEIVEVERVVEVPVETEKVVEVVREVEVPVETEVEKIVETEVEKIVEVEVEKVVEVEVEKVVEIETERIVISTPTPPPTGAPRFGGTLRVISHGSVSSVDPVFSLFAVVNYISKQFYEQLFAWDGDLNAQPQLVDTWSVSDDGLEYTFTVRASNFHDGDTFSAADAVASITRWRDAGTPAAGIIRRFTDDDAFDIVDRQTFTWNFNEPLGSTIFILGIPHGAMPMMREEDAATPFTTAVAERIGTGPYRFVRWDQGNRVVLERFDEYSPRSEPFQPGGYIGHTVAYIDKIEFLEIPDEETKMAGLETGEWDVIEFAGLDFFNRLNDNPDINVTTYAPGLRSNVYLNPQIPPFSYKLARQALQTGVKIEDFMFALGDPQLWQVCDAVYWCGTPLETHVGSTFDVELSDGTHTIGYNVYDVPTAQQLLAESDYAGETTIILNPTDLAVLTPLGPVLKPFMEEIGFNVEMPALDWSTITSMFGNTDSYSLATDAFEHYCCGSPIQDHLISGTLDFIIRDSDLINLQLEFARETDAARRAEIIDEIQSARWEKVTSLLLGQFFPMHPSSVDLRNWEVKAVPYYAGTWLERR